MLRNVLVFAAYTTIVLASALLGSEPDALPADAGPADLVEQDPIFDFDPVEESYVQGGSCSVSLDCGDGNTVSCSGNNSCSSHPFGGYVECDGNRTTCPNHCQVFLYCGGGPFCATCSSNSGNCQEGPGSISCNGWTTTCSAPICNR